MLDPSWEIYAVQLANAATSDVICTILRETKLQPQFYFLQAALHELKSVIQAHSIDEHKRASVYVAYDTRTSSISLRDIVLKAVKAYGSLKKREYSS